MLEEKVSRHWKQLQRDFKRLDPQRSGLVDMHHLIPALEVYGINLQTEPGLRWLARLARRTILSMKTVPRSRPHASRLGYRVRVLHLQCYALCARHSTALSEKQYANQSAYTTSS